jgi:hypothetical protein
MRDFLAALESLHEVVYAYECFESDSQSLLGEIDH